MIECENGAFFMEDIVILTTYGQHKESLNSILIIMTKKLGLRRKAFSGVMTVNYFQSKEAKMIILVTVITSGLRFVENENRINVACTRGLPEQATQDKDLQIQQQQQNAFAVLGQTVSYSLIIYRLSTDILFIYLYTEVD